MATYLYRGFTKDGQMKFGSLSESSEKNARNVLSDNGLTDLTVLTSETKMTTRPYQTVKPRTLAVFSRQMSMTVLSHITLVEGVELIALETDHKELKLTLEEMSYHLNQGFTFAESVAMYPHVFGTYFVNMVQTGEHSGNLDVIFNELSDFFESEHETRRKMRQAVFYPVTLALMMAGLILLMITKVIPLFESILLSRGGQIPSFTAAILNISHFLNQHLLLIIFIILLIAISISLFKRTNTGRVFFDRVKVTFPPTKYLYTRVITARFASSLGLLLKAGINLVNALEESTNIIDNAYLEPKFRAAIDEIKDKATLQEALEQIGIFPPLFLRMLAVGEKTGHLDEMLYTSSSLFQKEVDEAIEKTTSLIEPVLIIILSIILGVILVSIMVPMIDIMNTIS